MSRKIEKLRDEKCFNQMDLGIFISYLGRIQKFVLCILVHILKIVMWMREAKFKYAQIWPET